ncbi:MAG: hypothetical protein KKG92_06885 [Gammaproteobacteria bacterium]|nr:hypothetical protein [Gammaproteobacteria bacterium]
MKTPTLALVAFLSLAAGAAQADNRSCLFDSPTPSAVQTAPAPGAMPGARMNMPRGDMGNIETALRSGQITPYEAGRLMRRQWEIAQFQRGFLEGTQPARSNPVVREEGCGLGAGIDLAPLSDMAGNVAGSMAKNGMQTATKVMRALMRETERLIREQAAAEGSEI